MTTIPQRTIWLQMVMILLLLQSCALFDPASKAETIEQIFTALSSGLQLPEGNSLTWESVLAALVDPSAPPRLNVIVIGLSSIRERLPNEAETLVSLLEGAATRRGGSVTYRE